jgi:hypothetical protein
MALKTMSGSKKAAGKKSSSSGKGKVSHITVRRGKDHKGKAKGYITTTNFERPEATAGDPYPASPDSVDTPHADMASVMNHIGSTMGDGTQPQQPAGEPDGDEGQQQ